MPASKKKTRRAGAAARADEHTDERGGERAGERIAFAAIAQRLPFEDLRALLLHAEALGYEAAYIDGDLSMLPGHAGEVLDGWLVQSALAAASRRIRLAAMRLPHHWNALALAKAVATFERLHPQRQRLLFAVGGQPVDARAGLPFRAHRERAAATDEMLRALRALFAGEETTLRGRFVQLERARIQPALRAWQNAAPAGGGRAPLLEIGGVHARTLALVAAHADAWNINLPPVPALVARADAALADACAHAGRAPQTIERSLWLFARPAYAADDPRALQEFRALNPWFARIPDTALAGALLVGGAEKSRARLQTLREQLHLDLPVIDVTGLKLDEARHALDVFEGAGGEARLRLRNASQPASEHAD